MANDTPRIGAVVTINPGYPGQSMRSAMLTLVDGVLMAREASAVRGGEITAQELANLVADLIPIPHGRWTVDQALEYAAGRIVGGAVVAVELVNALAERVCAVTGESPADVLREALDALHPEQGETA